MAGLCGVVTANEIVLDVVISDWGTYLIKDVIMVFM